MSNMKMGPRRNIVRKNMNDYMKITVKVMAHRIMRKASMMTDTKENNSQANYITRHSTVSN